MEEIDAEFYTETLADLLQLLFVSVTLIAFPLLASSQLPFLGTISRLGIFLVA